MLKTFGTQLIKANLGNFFVSVDLNAETTYCHINNAFDLIANEAEKKSQSELFGSLFLSLCFNHLQKINSKKNLKINILMSMTLLLRKKNVLPVL